MRLLPCLIFLLLFNLSYSEGIIPVTGFIEFAGTGSLQSKEPRAGDFFKAIPSLGYNASIGVNSRVYKGMGVGIQYNFHFSTVVSATTSGYKAKDKLLYNRLGVLVNYQINIKRFFVTPVFGVHINWIDPRVDFYNTSLVTTSHLDTVANQYVKDSEEGFTGYAKYHGIGVSLTYQLNLGYQLKYVHPYLRIAFDQGMIKYYSRDMVAREYTNGVLANEAKTTFINRGSMFSIGIGAAIILQDIIQDLGKHSKGSSSNRRIAE